MKTIWGICINVTPRFYAAPMRNVARTLLASQTNCGGGVIIENEINAEPDIRKLTPKECFRLMGVKDDDFNKINHYCDAKLYHLAGDSIVTTCLMAIFGQLLDIDWESKINEVINQKNNS